MSSNTCAVKKAGLIAIGIFLLLIFNLIIANASVEPVLPTNTRTLSIIKPDATKRNIVGKITAKLEESGLRVVAQKKLLLTKAQAAKFYEVHKDKPFFTELIDSITAGSIVVQVLEGQNAVLKHRNIIGATNPSKAEPGTIRSEFGLNITKNSVHGSDSDENSAKEINFFFALYELEGL